MANKSKNKGKAFERQVAKFLSEVFQLNFERVPNSGAFIGGKNQFRKEKLSEEQQLLMDGDIITPSELSHVSLECKSYKSFRWHLLYEDGGENQLNTWIDQVSNTSKPLWFLCFKINNQGEFVVFDTIHDQFYLSSPYMIYHYNNHQYYIVNMKNFFKDKKDKILELGQYYENIRNK